MTSTPTFDRRAAVLRASLDELATLLVGEPARLPWLVRVGAVDAGVVHPRIRRAVASVVAPVHGVLRLSYDGRWLDGWLGETGAAVRSPDPSSRERHSLVHFAPSMLVGALATAVALRPRRRPSEPLASDELAASSEIERWWTLLRGPADGTPGCLLEVVDTFAGLYVVDAAGTAQPSDPTEVFRLLIRAVGPEERGAPLRPLPPAPFLPRAAEFS